LPLDRLSPRAKAGLAVALALLLWIPQGISEQTTPVVTGHSVFYNGSTYDKCLASIAGILRSQVLWFNDQVLVERYPGKGTYIFVTENGTTDPTHAPYLISEGVRFSFTDPNGADWVIHEAYFKHEETADGTKVSGTSVSVGAEIDKTYVWYVELAAEPILDQFPGEEYPHSIYNFLVLVDTCKFHRNAQTSGPVAHHNETAILNDRHGHPNGELEHDHETWKANLWVGKRPVVVEAADTGDHVVQETGWAGVQDDPDRPQADGDHYDDN
jgi:hypothetical protein